MYYLIQTSNFYLLYLVISLSIVSELTVVSQTGCKDTHFFFTSKFFCNIFTSFFEVFTTIFAIFLYINILRKMRFEKLFKLKNRLPNESHKNRH